MTLTGAKSQQNFRRNPPRIRPRRPGMV